MIIKTLVFKILSHAARNPVVQQKAKYIAKNAVSKAKPSLLKSSRIAGRTYSNIKEEIKRGVDNYKKERQ